MFELNGKGRKLGEKTSKGIIWSQKKPVNLKTLRYDIYLCSFLRRAK